MTRRVHRRMNMVFLGLMVAGLLTILSQSASATDVEAVTPSDGAANSMQLASHTGPCAWHYNTYMQTYQSGQQWQNRGVAWSDMNQCSGAKTYAKLWYRICSSCSYNLVGADYVEGNGLAQVEKYYNCGFTQMCTGYKGAHWVYPPGGGQWGPYFKYVGL